MVWGGLLTSLARLHGIKEEIFNEGTHLMVRRTIGLICHLLN